MPRLDAIYRGVVTRTNDPEGLGRIRATVPQALGRLECAWAWPATPNIDGIPALDVGDPVWVAFEGGEVEKPVWLGTWPRPGAPLDEFEAFDIEEHDLHDHANVVGVADETLIWMLVSP